MEIYFKIYLLFELFFAGINQENLVQVLQILLKVKLLNSIDDETNLQGSSLVELNMGFRK